MFVISRFVAALLGRDTRKKGGTGRPQRPNFRPHLESLGERVAPAVVTLETLTPDLYAPAAVAGVIAGYRLVSRPGRAERRVVEAIEALAREGHYGICVIDVTPFGVIVVR